MKDAQTLGMGDIPGSSSRFKRLSNDRDSRPSLLAALSEWEAIANEARVSKAALAYRWLMYNSRLTAEHGDGMIVRILETHITSSNLSSESWPMSAKWTLSKHVLRRKSSY